MVQLRPDTFPLYPEPSFPHPVPPPVADAEPEAVVCIPNMWLPYVLGALQQLIEPTTWQGTDEEIQAVQADAATLIDSIANPTCVVASETQTPFWDTATDVDDDADPALQPWYGEVTDPEAAPAELDFVENIAIWTFTGMLAVGATPAAAILFHTIAPRFVLAMRGDDFGEVIRIVLDGEDMARVDTSGHAGEVLRVPIVGDPTISTHDLYVINLGAP